MLTHRSLLRQLSVSEFADHLLTFEQDNGFVGIDKSCTDFKNDSSNTKYFALKYAHSESDGECSVFEGHVIKAIYYNW